MAGSPVSPPTAGSPGGSANGRNGPAADRTLDSWKEIGSHLGVSARTARRWEGSAGLPVHRVPSGRVFAQSSELDRWRLSRPKPIWRRPLLLGGLVLAAVAAVTGIYLFRYANAAGIPASVKLDGENVLALDRLGRTRWTASVPTQAFDEWSGWHVSTPDRSLVADVDRDGAVEVLVNALVRSHTDGPERLICFAQNDGRVRWQFEFGRAFKDAYGEYPQNYRGHILRAVRAGGRSYILTVAAHRRWHPCQVALLDASTGRLVEEFWHPGAITHALLADIDGDGTDELVLAGVNNPGAGPGSPVLMTLRLPFSLAPPAPGSLMGDMSSGGPTAYVVFPRPDTVAAEGELATIQTLEFEAPATLLAHVRFKRDRNSTVSYQFDAGLRLRRFLAPLDLATAHDTLWRSGVLTHPFSDRERDWLQGVRSYAAIPDGNAVRIPPFDPSR